MRAFDQKRNHPHAAAGVARARPGRLPSEAEHHRSFVPIDENDVGPTDTRTGPHGHDFGRIAVLPVTTGAIQTKPVVDGPGDEYEREADRISDQVMSMPEPQRGTGGMPGITMPAVQSDPGSSGGQSLDLGTRAYFEPRFGRNLGDVRIHTGAAAAQSARAINANAYTSGRDIVFADGRYAPDSTDGRRLLAHELVHVQQQRGMTSPGTGGVIQRQPNSSPLPDPSSDPTVPDFPESHHAPSYHIRIVAHASPRWRGARGNAEADRNNLQLSRQRAEQVRLEVEKLLADRMLAGASVTIDLTVDQPDDTVTLESDARGSRDTLPEAGGDRSDDALQRRRVDVIVESTQRIEGMAGGSRPLLTRPTASKFWHVSVGVVAGGSLGAAGSLMTLSLINDSTGQTMEGTVIAVGGGPKASLGVTTSIWSDPSYFSTDREVDFQDFDGAWVRYSTFGINAFIGYEKSYLSILGFGRDAVSINVGGWSTGTVGVGGSVQAGKLSLSKPYPPTRVPIADTDTIVQSYQRTERGEDKHRVLFATQSSTLDRSEAAILDSFIASVVTARP